MGKKSKARKNLASGGLLLFIYQKRVLLITITNIFILACIFFSVNYIIFWP